MPVSGMKAAFGWVGQTAQDAIPLSAYYNTNGMTWHKMLAGDMSIQDDQRPYDPEIGGSILPPGSYKSSYWSAGQFAMRPRLAVSATATKANGLAPLFWAFAGGCANVAHSVVIDQVAPYTFPASVLGTATTVADITGMAGVHDVLFFPGANSPIQFGSEQGDGDNKWLTVRRLIPTTTGWIGESFYNVKVAGINISSASTGPLGLEVTLLGGAGNSDSYDQYALENFTGTPTAADGWDFTSAAGVTSIPMTGGGFVKQGSLSSSEIKNVRDLQISLQGNITGPQDTTMVGQFAPGSYSILGRRIGISYTFLWENADLFRAIKLGSSSGTEWSQTVYSSPFWTSFPNLDATTAMGFFAQNVHWMNAPVGVQGESQVIMRVTGMVADAVGAQWGLWIAKTGAGSLSAAGTWPSA